MTKMIANARKLMNLEAVHKGFFDGIRPCVTRPQCAQRLVFEGYRLGAMHAEF